MGGPGRTEPLATSHAQELEPESQQPLSQGPLPASQLRGATAGLACEGSACAGGGEGARPGSWPPTALAPLRPGSLCRSLF